MRRTVRLGEASTVRGRHFLVAGLIIFTVIATLAVVLNSFVFGYGFDVARSISRYVGFEVWSVLLFAIGNCFVVAAVARALFKIGEAWHMPKVFYWLTVIMCVALIWLSVFPIGMFDAEGSVSLISWLHILGSRTLFVVMMIVACMIAGNQYASPMTHGVCVGYMVYAIFCVVGHLTEASWFLPYTLIFESSYIVGFLVMLLFCKTRTSRRIK